MYKACIFDLDGTLADTLESMAYVTNVIMEKFGLKTLPVDNFRYYSGEGASMLIRSALKDAGDPELTQGNAGDIERAEETWNEAGSLLQQTASGSCKSYRAAFRRRV